MSIITPSDLDYAAHAYDWMGSARYDGVADSDESLRRDIETVVADFIDNPAYATERAAATDLAVALRPLVPVPTSTTLYITGGAPGRGKSWTARQARAFTGDHRSNADLSPAKDAEALATHPLWVIENVVTDDTWEGQRSANDVGTLVRSVFTGKNVRQMNKTASGPKPPAPRAVLVVTSETEHPIASIRARSIHLRLNTECTAEVHSADIGASTRVAAAISRIYTPNGVRNSPIVVTGAHVRRAALQSLALHTFDQLGIDPGLYSREAGIAADAMVGLAELGNLAWRLGMADVAHRISASDNHQALIIRAAEQVALSIRPAA